MAAIFDPMNADSFPQVVNEPSSANGTTRPDWSPYSANGGTIVGIAGDNFACLGSDTRLSEGYFIHSRDAPKIYHLGDCTALASCGFHGDVLTLNKVIDMRLKLYKYQHSAPMSTAAAAAMISKMLYYRRFFPYYTYNIVAGLDNEGKGAVYSFDPVGSYEREFFRAAGTSSSLLQPLLDNQLAGRNLSDEANARRPKLTVDRCVDVIHDVFVSATERDIYTGDAVEVCIVEAAKPGTCEGAKYRTVRIPLRRD